MACAAGRLTEAVGRRQLGWYERVKHVGFVFVCVLEEVQGELKATGR